MARHRRRHYRGVGSLVRFPGLGNVSIPKSVNPVDVAVGVGAGFVGAAALNYGLRKANVVPPAIVSSSPLVGGIATGAALYLFEKKKNKQRAASHAVGALLGGLAVWGYQMLSTSGLPGFSGLVRLPGGFGGPIMSNPFTTRLGGGRGFGGPILSNPATRLAVNHARLARLQGLGDDNEDGNFPAP